MVPNLQEGLLSLILHHRDWLPFLMQATEPQALCPVLCPTSSVPSQNPKELTRTPQSLPCLFCHSTMSRAPPHHEAQQGFPSRVGDERARRGVASICPGLRLSQRKYLKQISSSSEELKVDLSIP